MCLIYLPHQPGFRMSVTALEWSLATPFGIAIDEDKDASHTGHIKDVVQLDGGAAGMLVAFQSGASGSSKRTTTRCRCVTGGTSQT